MANKRIFNLLKPIPPAATFWDKVYEWILGRARVVILITELLIVFAFVAKVLVDTEARGREEQVNSLKEELAIYAVEKEPMFRDIQRKDSAYRNIWQNANKYSEVIEEINSYILNSGVQLTIRADKNRVSVLGYDDLSAVQNLESKMKASDTFTSVFVETLNLDQKEILQSTGEYVLVATLAEVNRGILN